MTIKVLSKDEMKRKKISLPLLSIEAAEELQRLKLGKKVIFESTKELSRMIKEDFPRKTDYTTIFKNAYKLTYSEDIENKGENIPEKHLLGISNNLANPSDLEKELELKTLIDFCVNLSNQASSYEQYLESLRTPCFR